ncbi:MAG: hypothetical protein WB985_13570 [Candidatus Acidiferrales bacterium]
MSPQSVRCAERIATFDQDGTKFGTFAQDYFDPAIKNGWIVIGMKDDWKRILHSPGSV